MIIHSKRSGDGGGGGYSITRPTRTEREFRADIILHVDSKNGTYIHKNRYGPHGKVNTEELVGILCHILSEHLFYNSKIKLFREGMRLRLKQAINRIIKKG